ncbi:MAG: hypothetical protein ABFS17_05905 [Chloroflexota bacterium]
MSTIYPDTHPEIEDLQLKLVRDLPAWKKLEMRAQLNQTAQSLALSGLRQRYPHAKNPELKRHLADLLLGAELANKVYGELDDDA